MSRRERTRRRQRAVRRAVISTIWGIMLCSLALIALPAMLSGNGFASTGTGPVRVTIGLGRQPERPADGADEPEAEVTPEPAETPAAETERPAQTPPAAVGGTERPEETAPPAETVPPEEEPDSGTENPPEGESAGEFAPVPESEAVDDGYFADAVFIGDSRTQGLRLYSGLKDTTWLCSVGLTVETAYTEKFSVAGGQYSAVDALGALKPAKVYIMLGLNELGWKSADIFIEKYAGIIDAALAANPDCEVYVQSILPVSASKDAAGTWCNNKNVLSRNERLIALAEEKGVNYLDVASAFKDENGCLPESSTPDGVHLNPGLCVSWLDYLKTHTVTEVEA